MNDNDETEIIESIESGEWEFVSNSLFGLYTLNSLVFKILIS